MYMSETLIISDNTGKIKNMPKLNVETRTTIPIDVMEASRRPKNLTVLFAKNYTVVVTEIV